MRCGLIRPRKAPSNIKSVEGVGVFPGKFLRRALASHQFWLDFDRGDVKAFRSLGRSSEINTGIGMYDGSKLEGYLLLAKGARGLALADLIQKVTAEPGIFTFGELLDLPNVKEVKRTHQVLAANPEGFGRYKSCAYQEA